jgi:hypothetical protein
VVLSSRDLDPAVTARLGRAGADKVLLCEGPGLDAPPLEATHGPALLTAVERVAPLLVLFPAGGGGAALGPALAARIGAAFTGAADLEATDAAGPLPEGVGRAFVRRWDRERAAYRRLDPVEIERAVVAVLPAGGPPAQLGSEEIDVEVIAAARPTDTGVEELAREPDPDGLLPLCRVLVVIDPALGATTSAELAVRAPPGVAIVDRDQARRALLSGAPEILIAIGSDWPPAGTPRGRVGAVLINDGTSPAHAVDVLWRIPAAATGGELLAAVSMALATLDPEAAA